MNWKAAKKATIIFSCCVVGLCVILVTAPYSLVVAVAAVMWWVIYDACDE